MQGCEEALTEYIQENLLIVATVAITFVIAEVHMHTQYAYDVINKLDYTLSVSQGLNLDNIIGAENSVPNGDQYIAREDSG